MIQAVRTMPRHGHRNATLILLAFRHGLRAAELVSLRWDQVNLKEGFLTVHRRKQGQPATHPLWGAGAAGAAAATESYGLGQEPGPAVWQWSARPVHEGRCRVKLAPLSEFADIALGGRGIALGKVAEDRVQVALGVWIEHHPMGHGRRCSAVRRSCPRRIISAASKGSPSSPRLNRSAAGRSFSAMRSSSASRSCSRRKPASTISS